MNYSDALEYLNSFVNYERQHDAESMRQVRLERMHRICQRLGDPHRRFRSVLVTGTNGKGSVCAMLYSMLRESSLRVGLYTSPHLEHVRERIRVWTSGSAEERVHAEDWIGETAFAATMEQLQAVLEPLRKREPELAPTYFEALTALALMYFNQRQVDVAILEVGLGGRLDATNVVEQAVSVITPIDFDHTDVLGLTLAKIAQEKSGVIKPGQTVLTAEQSPQVMEVLRAACDAQGVPLLVFGQDLTARIHAHDADGLQVSLTGLRGIYESLDLPLLGRHQAQNAALAVGALEALSPSGIPHTMVEEGLAQVDWPGRIELVHERPLVILDGAHNPHAARALVQTLTELWPDRRMHCIIGMSADKSIEAVGQCLGPLAHGATCTKSRHPRALDPTELAKRLTPLFPDVHVITDAVDAYTYVLNAVSPDDIVVVMGSLFLVGELRAALRQSHVRSRRKATQTTIT